MNTILKWWWFHLKVMGHRVCTTSSTRQNAYRPLQHLTTCKGKTSLHFQFSKALFFLRGRSKRTHFLCCAEDRRVQMRATMTTTTTVTAPTDTTMMTRRLLFFWGVTLPCGGRIWPMGGSETHNHRGTWRGTTLRLQCYNNIQYAQTQTHLSLPFFLNDAQ